MLTCFSPLTARICCPMTSALITYFGSYTCVSSCDSGMFVQVTLTNYRYCNDTCELPYATAYQPAKFWIATYCGVCEQFIERVSETCVWTCVEAFVNNTIVNSS